MMGRRKRSYIWNFFDVFGDPEERRAKCKCCSKTLSYSSTITNLKYHLQKLHERAFKEFCRLNTKCNKESDRDRGDANGDDSKSSEEQVDQLEDSTVIKTDVKDVRSVFDMQTGGRGRCTLCLSSVSYQDSEMKRHLKSRHPIKYSQIYGDTNSNASDSEEIFKDVIYLEEQYHSPPPPTTPKPSLKRTPYRRFSTKRLRSPSPEIIMRKTEKKSNQDEEIEKFATYITHLLKSVTPEVCSKLQMEIINLIMSEKLKKPETSAAELSAPIIIQQLVQKNSEALTERLGNGGESKIQSNNQDTPSYVVRIENSTENGK